MKQLTALLIVFLSLASFPAQSADRYLNIHSGSEPETIDPGMASGNVEHRVLTSMFEGLTIYHPQKMTAVPGIAERWTVSPDGKTYTFFLRNNAQWSDGTPIAAQDFVYSYERMLNPNTGAHFAHHLFILKGAQDYNAGKTKDFQTVGVKARDPHTLVLTLNHPAPYFLYMTSHYPFFPVPQQAIAKHDNRWTRPENIVVSGPFMLKEWVPQKTITVVKNHRYWNASAIKASGINFLPIEDNETALKMFEGGQLDVLWNLPVSKAPALRSHPDYRSAPQLSSYYYWLNTQDPKLKDVRVRTALALAIDRKTLTEKYLHGLHSPSGNYSVPGIPGYTPLSGFTFDPVKAKALLKEAGVDPASLQIEILYNTMDLHKSIAEVIQQMWRQNLGVNATLHNEEWKSYLKDMQQKNFMICRAAWGGDFPDAMTFLENMTSASPQNYSNWSSAKYDALINQAQNESNVAKRNQQLHDAEAVLIEEVPLVPIMQQNKDFMIKPYVKGYYSNSLDVHPWQFVFIDGDDTTAPWQSIRKQFKKG
ncbi:MAG: ABC transporter substrate-binding protein [Deltaproteobacteria bacterium CG11_big_fil_rev_8_21_14_0_20_47_16]|nr:MAG: ABC transporter substrate-binding protein [Deltaproteobacteria bacterium CG11_big_fil_rev_8_21_14_0_20_47_16]